MRVSHHTLPLIICRYVAAYIAVHIAPLLPLLNAIAVKALKTLYTNRVICLNYAVREATLC